MEDDIPIAPSLYSLSNKMDNSLLAVRDINHKYIVVVMEEDENEECFNGLFLPKSLRVSQRYGIFKVYFCQNVQK